MDIWALIQEGHFEEACKIADSEYTQSKSLLSLRNKVYALFHLKRYEEAYQLGNRIIEVNEGKSDVDFIFSGIALWLLGRKKEAIERWGNTEEVYYKDAAGGIDVQVLLYFGAVKTGDGNLNTNVLKNLKKLVKPKRTGVHLPYYIGLKQYELTNHLGNVLATITEKKFGVSLAADSSLIDHYQNGALGKYVPNAIKSQMWNLKPFATQAEQIKSI